MSSDRSASLRLKSLNTVMARVAKPRLERTSSPLVARSEFALVTRRLVRRPPFLLRRVRKAGSETPPVHWISAGARRCDAVIFYIHGGAYFAGSPATHEGLIGHLCRLTGMEAAAPVYRRVPEAPAPAAYDDVCSAFDLLAARGYRSDQIVLAGDSAGGGLAMALLARLCAQGRPPACSVAFSPWVDLTLASASLKTNAVADPLLPVSRMAEVVGYVLGPKATALSPTDPRVSPVFAQYTMPPPTLIQVGTTEILRDDALRMASRLRSVGGEVTLSLWPEAPHLLPMFLGYLPEARDALEEAARFIRRTVAPAPEVL